MSLTSKKCFVHWRHLGSLLLSRVCPPLVRATTLSLSLPLQYRLKATGREGTRKEGAFVFQRLFTRKADGPACRLPLLLLLLLCIRHLHLAKKERRNETAPRKASFGRSFGRSRSVGRSGPLSLCLLSLPTHSTDLTAKKERTNFGRRRRNAGVGTVLPA